MEALVVCLPHILRRTQEREGCTAKSSRSGTILDWYEVDLDPPLLSKRRHLKRQDLLLGFVSALHAS